jgi:hypothetical protein
VTEYEQWLLGDDLDVALRLLRRIAGQAARTGTFPPPQDYGRWSDEAIDELLVQMIEKKGGVSFLLEALKSVDNQGSAERYLQTTVQNFLKDQAKTTPHGKLRARLETLLGSDERFEGVASPDRGWRLANGPSQWWQGDITTLHHATLQVRGVHIPSWNTSGPTPRSAREALTKVAFAVLTTAASIVRAEDLAKVLLERFRHEIAPETVDHVALSEVDEQTGPAYQEPEHALVAENAGQLWTRFNAEQRAIVPYLTTPDLAAKALGIGPREAAARRAQVIEFVRMATVDDPRAEEVVDMLLKIASLPNRPAPELARPSPERPANIEGMMGP